MVLLVMQSRLCPAAAVGPCWIDQPILGDYR
jgi:hypothetical protein